MTTHTELAAQRAEFEAAMVARGYERPQRGLHPDSQYLYTEDQDRFIGFCAALESTERLAGGGAKGVIIDAYAFPSATQFGNEIRVQRTRQIEGPALWKVVDGRGNCLNKSGEWEWEPMPSSRDAEFLSRCRFPTADAAIERAHGITPKEGT